MMQFIMVKSLLPLGLVRFRCVSLLTVWLA